MFRRCEDSRHWFIRVISCVLTISVLFSACAKRTMSSWQEQYDLGVRYLSEGNYEEAIIAFSAAIEIEKRAEAYVGRGQAFLLSAGREGDTTVALSDFEMAISLDSGNDDAWQAMINIYINNGEYDRAAELIDQARHVLGSSNAFEDEYDNLNSRRVVDVLLENIEKWEGYLIGEAEVLDGSAWHAFFADLDFDGVSEFIVESPTVGSGNITVREIFRIDSNRLIKTTKDAPETGDWDEISLWKDNKSGEYYYVGYDLTQDGWQHATEQWAKLYVEGNELKAYLLYMKDTQYYISYYKGDEKTKISGEEFYALMEQERADADELGLWRGAIINDWDAQKSIEDKKGILLSAYESDPLWETENDGRVTWVEFAKSRDSGFESAVIRGLDSSGYPVWTYSSKSYMETELDQVAGIGMREDAYYFVESGVVYAVDMQTGKLKWENADFGGASPSSAFTNEGTLLLSGFYGPDFFAVSLEGKTLANINMFDDDYLWADDITVDRGRAIVHFEMGPGQNESGYNFYVNLNDWSYGYLGERY